MKTYYFHTKPNPISPKRRATVAGIIDTDNNQLLFGVAECSKRDQFNRKMGRIIAQGRAAKNPVRVVNLSSFEPNEIGKLFVKHAAEIAN